MKQAISYNNQSIRQWRGDFYSKGGEFSPYRRGCYPRYQVLEDEQARKKAFTYLRLNVSKKGQHFTATKFMAYVNSNLLTQLMHLPQHYPNSISLPTARRWMHQLGFSPTSSKKGTYFDGHEREDVKEFRKIFLRKLEILGATHMPPPLCEDPATAFPTGNSV